MEIINTSPDREITTKRVFNFPVETVYKAWTDPTHLQKWWGPNGFTNTFNFFELKPGGKWDFIMHGPDQGNYPNECVFIITEENQLIVLDHLSNPKFYIIAQFKKIENSRTELTFRQLFGSVELYNKIKSFAAGKNEENMDRLEEELKRM